MPLRLSGSEGGGEPTAQKSASSSFTSPHLHYLSHTFVHTLQYVITSCLHLFSLFTFSGWIQWRLGERTEEEWFGFWDACFCSFFLPFLIPHPASTASSLFIYFIYPEIPHHFPYPVGGDGM
ncbi:uncharacterized protein BKA78DRAFT_177326 [Phyllosticta capitalensis]|uniref:Transmembrane protein n=1 Tax=Phyllosticta capitalensis TaxID=121624 RepID=A0ABR1YA93_9PEZI